MSTYEELQQDLYYLIQETEDDELMLVKPVLITSKCVLLVGNDGESDYTFWKKLDDEVFDIVEELTEEQGDEYENLFDDDDDDF